MLTYLLTFDIFLASYCDIYRAFSSTALTMEMHNPPSAPPSPGPEYDLLDDDEPAPIFTDPFQRRAASPPGTTPAALEQVGPRNEVQGGGEALPGRRNAQTLETIRARHACVDAEDVATVDGCAAAGGCESVCGGKGAWTADRRFMEVPEHREFIRLLDGMDGDESVAAVPAETAGQDRDCTSPHGRQEHRTYDPDLPIDPSLPTANVVIPSFRAFQTAEDVAANRAAAAGGQTDGEASQAAPHLLEEAPSNAAARAPVHATAGICVACRSWNLATHHHLPGGLRIDGRGAPPRGGPRPDTFSVQIVHADGKLLGQWDGVVSAEFERQHARPGPRFSMRELHAGRAAAAGGVTRDVVECTLVCENGDEWDCWLREGSGVLAVDQWTCGGVARAVVGPGTGGRGGGVKFALGGGVEGPPRPAALPGRGAVVRGAARRLYQVSVHCERHHALIGIYKGVAGFHVVDGVGELGESFLVDVRDARGVWIESFKRIKGLEIEYLDGAEFELKPGRGDERQTVGKGNEGVRMRGGAGDLGELDGAGNGEDGQTGEGELRKTGNRKGKGKAVEDYSSTPSETPRDHTRRVRRDGPCEIIDNPEPDYILGRTASQDRNIDDVCREEAEQGDVDMLWEEADGDDQTWSLDGDDEISSRGTGDESHPWFSIDDLFVKVGDNLVGRGLAMKMGLIPDDGHAGASSARIPSTRQSRAGMVASNPRSTQPDAGTGGSSARRPQGKKCRASPQDASAPANVAGASKARGCACSHQGNGTPEVLDHLHEYIHKPSESPAEDGVRFNEHFSFFQTKIKAGIHPHLLPHACPGHPGPFSTPAFGPPPHGACCARHAAGAPHGTHAFNRILANVRDRGRAAHVPFTPQETERIYRECGARQRASDAREAKGAREAALERREKGASAGHGKEKRVRFRTNRESSEDETGDEDYSDEYSSDESDAATRPKAARQHGPRTTGLCEHCRSLCVYCSAAKRHRRAL